MRHPEMLTESKIRRQNRCLDTEHIDVIQDLDGQSCLSRSVSNASVRTKSALLWRLILGTHLDKTNHVVGGKSGHRKPNPVLSKDE
jgi:hypothetical protein